MYRLLHTYILKIHKTIAEIHSMPHATVLGKNFYILCVCLGLLMLSTTKFY